jgi:hypothetical protein
MAALVSDFVNLRKPETDCQQPVLLPHRPGARKAETLAQPQHGLEALDRAPGRVEGLEATHGIGFLYAFSYSWLHCLN